MDSVNHDASFYLRVGENRKAALIYLGEFRETLTPAVPLLHSLLKIRRFRLALILSLLLAKQDPAKQREASDVAAVCVFNISVSEAQIDQGLGFLRHIDIHPDSIALVASRLDSAESRDDFIAKSIKAFSYGELKSSMLQAFVSAYIGDVTAALAISQKLFIDHPVESSAGLLAARILAENDYPYHARKFSCAVLRREKHNTAALDLLGACLNKESKWKATRKIYERLHGITGDDISLFNQLTALPSIQASASDTNKAIESFSRLSEIVDSPGLFKGIEYSFNKCSTHIPGPFFLPYQGPVSVKVNLEASRAFARQSAHDLIRDVQIAYSSPLVNVSSSIHKAPQNIRKQSRIRIGFVSRFFSGHSNLEAHYGLIQMMNREAFEVVLVHRPGVKLDEAHHEINKYADQCVYLSQDFGDACRNLYELSLDIAFYSDIGMMAFDSILAMPHLARVQVTSWGLPHTTGVREIDYMLRSIIFSECEGADEYTESLLQTEGYIGYFDYSRYAFEPRSRDFFLLPPDRFLVGCLQSIHKIHPDFDLYLEQIAQIDESLLIVMSPSVDDRSMERFVRRLKKNAPTAYNQLCIVARTSIQDFFALNSLLDINLDTIYYGAGVTFVQTAWCGPPYVTQRSNLVRSSVVSATYSYAGIVNPPVASNMLEYINLVRKYFWDRDACAALREEVQEKTKKRIYKDLSYVRSNEELFSSIVQRL